MKPTYTLFQITVVIGYAAAQSIPATGTKRVIPTLSPQVNALPSLTPTIYDESAPNPQDCPGYIASNVLKTDSGFTAALTIAGANCQAFGNDIADLVLEVQFQAKERLNVRIYPKYIAPSNSSWFLILTSIVDQPEWDGKQAKRALTLSSNGATTLLFSFAFCASALEKSFSQHMVMS